VAGDQGFGGSVACPQFEPWHPGGVDERTWLTVPDIAERLDVSASQVRRMIEDRNLLAVRRNGVVSVPEVFLTDEGPLPELRGTAILLGDSGFGNDEAVRWLLEPDDSLGIAPIDALRAGRKAEVRRVAQALAF
jgi:hypothetical protein